MLHRLPMFIALAPAHIRGIERPRPAAAQGATRWLGRHGEWLWLAALLLLAGAIHGINMFDYPYIHDDEGSYTAYAWAVITSGELAHYTYFYEHSPVGWFQIAGWMLLTERLGLIDAPIHSARALMLVVQVASVFVLYRLAKALTGSIFAATLAVLLFALTPYGVYWHRRAMLDNFMTLWMLVSLLLAIGGRPTLGRTWLSGLAMGLSILSKMTTLAVIPVLVYILYRRFHGSRRWLAIIGWTTVMGSLVSLWVLMATIKSELFPSGTLLGGEEEHVSLLESVFWQASREKDAGFFDRSSELWFALNRWLADEPILVIGGTACAIVLCLGSLWNRMLGAIGMATLLLWLFTGRGGVVNDHFLLPLLPLLALSIALVAHGVVARLGRGVGRLPWPSAYARPALIAAVVLAGLAGSFYWTYPQFLTNQRRFPGATANDANRADFWRNRQSDAQWRALSWLQDNVSHNSALIIDDSIWVEYRQPPNGKGGFPYAHYYHKLESDPEIREGVFHDNWRNVDYLVSSEQLVNDVLGGKMTLVPELLANSTPITDFNSGGWPVEIRRVNKLNQWPAAQHPMLRRTWANYKTEFIADGRVVVSGISTSESQSAAMLQAVYMNDRATFDQLWRWTATHLQVRGDGLLASRWRAEADGTPRIDRLTATAGDQDVALALLFASQRWSEPAYYADALPILGGIWDQETVRLGGRRVLVAGDWARGNGTAGVQHPVVNVSTFAPYAYRIFAAADPGRPWAELVDSSYDMLRDIQASQRTRGERGLVANWVILEHDRRVFSPASSLGPGAAQFSSDAARVSWHLSLDWLWFQDERARAGLANLSLPREELKETGRLFTSYGLDGRPILSDIGGADEALWMYSTQLGNLLIAGDVDQTHRIFAEKILRRYSSAATSASWGEPTAHLDQTWGWYAVALMDGGLANLWAGERVIDWQKALAGRP